MGYSKGTVPGMVDTFKTKYEALEIPYPSDQGTLAAIDAQNAEMKVSYESFIKEADAAITEKEGELAKWTGMKCVSEMNLEEALDAGLVGTTIKGIPHPDKPTFWPHLEVIYFQMYSYTLAFILIFVL